MPHIKHIKCDLFQTTENRVFFFFFGKWMDEWMTYTNIHTHTHMHIQISVRIEKQTTKNKADLKANTIKGEEEGDSKREVGVTV